MTARAMLWGAWIAVSACPAPTPPAEPSLDQPFTLQVGQTAVLASGALRITFLEVSGDSRCPAHVVCVWGGDAAVRVEARAPASAAQVVLHTHDGAAAAPVLNYRVQLLQLSPYPQDPGRIDPKMYEAKLVVSLEE